MTDYAAVLEHSYPGALWGIVNNDYANLTWHETNAVPKPSKAELDAAWPAVAAALTKRAIQDARAARYRTETDPLFFKAQRGEDSVTLEEWQAAVDQIRADLPYPS